MERIQKIIAESGFCSRRKAELYIKQGKVLVNGKKVTELGTKASGDDEIIVDNEKISRDEKVYYILNKPRGYVSTTDDEKGRKIITELIEETKRVFPVGRLDYDTTGIILLTNDGELTNLLNSSKNNVEKKYIAKVKGFVTKEELITLSKGINLNGKKTKKALLKMKRYDKKTDSSYIYITITEGRNHQVKEMFNYIGHEVLKLKREKYSFLDINDLKPGEYRQLTIKEVKKLYNDAK